MGSRAGGKGDLPKGKAVESCRAFEVTSKKTREGVWTYDSLRVGERNFQTVDLRDLD